ncbi:MAG: type II secretion system F family protein [Clostridia bacterium]|nr:type II secretion system F family protein [Clostridia bacterium]
MAIYSYKAVSKTGQVFKSKMSDESEENVVHRLKMQGLTPISIKKELNVASIVNPNKKEKKNRAVAIVVNETLAKTEAENKAKKRKKKDLSADIDLSFLDTVTTDDVIAFTQMLLLLKKANFTNMRALTTMLSNTKNSAMKNIIEDILNGLEAGQYIYSTLEYYDKIFPPIYINIIKVGELSGSLVTSLAQALKYIQDSTSIKKKVKKALTGPLLQSGGLLLGSIIAVIFGIPVMEDMYAQFGLEDQIPEATMKFAEFIYWCGDFWYIVLGIIAAIAALFVIWKKTPSGRYSWDMFKLRMPIFGPLILRLNLQKFFKAMQINLANNARIQESIDVSKTVVGNYVIVAALETAQANLAVGGSWIEPFEKMSFFPPMILEMLRIGMETDMPAMIDKILEFIEEDIQITIDRLTKVLPEVGNAVMGVILIGFVWIILKPIMEVYMGSFLFEAYGM